MSAEELLKDKQVASDRVKDALSARIRFLAVRMTSLLACLHLAALLFLSSSTLVLGLRSLVLLVPALSWLAELALWRREGRRDLAHHLLAIVGLLLCVRAGQTVCRANILPLSFIQRVFSKKHIAILLADASTVVVEESRLPWRVSLTFFFLVRLVLYPIVCLWAVFESETLTMTTSKEQIFVFLRLSIVFKFGLRGLRSVSFLMSEPFDRGGTIIVDSSFSAENFFSYFRFFEDLFFFDTKSPI